MHAKNVLKTYESVAATFDRERDKSLFERRWLDRALNHATGRRVLDLGCGSGRPIAQYMSERRATVTGVDGAPAMIELFQKNLPKAEAIVADMRTLDLGKKFDIILAWNSFFHLSPDDQRGMFPVFAAHAAPGAVLLFTSGPAAGEPIGQVGGQPIYHSSFDPPEYRTLLDDNGFEEIAFVPEDPDCQMHSVWMCRKRPSA
ncbi:class I SAM-dependent methyltransferase [Actibacterium pelagium]|uniref:Methyltransferase n=1 Tax=Actibacterium pelagium TaxID=2029103 RepID=A0A917AET7_9RHOB|nr:class I SAM-dependent methyltransferase [Actibacterium pelagium]GGE45264.1 methyltransferase [Actibacterium pelagium]